MLIKLTVSALAAALLFVIVLILRQRAKMSAENNKEAAFEDKKEAAESFENLTLDQLEQKLLELDQYKEYLSKDFIHMHVIKQKNVLTRVSILNRKIEKVKEVIRENHYKGSTIVNSESEIPEKV